MEILRIILIITTLFLAVFFIATVYILIVFLFRFKKNGVLNKSVSKSLFDRKLSLTIILLFFGISFAFVGGMQLAVTGGKNSILQTFEEGKVWHYEMKESSFFEEEDHTLEKMALEYNYEQEANIPVKYATSIYELQCKELYEFISNEKFVDYDFTDYEIGEGNDELDAFLKYLFKNPKAMPKPLPKEEADKFTEWLKEKEYIDENNSFDDYVFANYDYYKYAVQYAIFTKLNDPQFDQDILNAINKLFLYNINTLTNFIIYTYNLDYIIKNNFFIHDGDFPYDIDMRAYYNFTPRTSSTNEVFEFILFPDRVKYLPEWLPERLSKWLSESKWFSDIFKEQKVSKTLGKDFNYESFMDMQSTSENEFNVVVQEDCLKANNWKPGDKIELVSGKRLKIVEPVRFSEVTYGITGTNFLVDEKKQVFVGIKASDYIKLISSLSTGTYNSTYNRAPSYYFRDKKLNNLKEADWIGEKDTLTSQMVDNLNKEELKNFNKDNTFIRLDNAQYNDLISKPLPGSVSKSWFKERYKMPWNISENGDFMGNQIKNDSMATISQLNSFESIRALLGLLEMRGFQLTIGILVIVFTFIILIVLSLLVSKRINNSGKQLGTLKAMGMKNNKIASSYILFPLIIIAIGFIIVLLISPIIMILFNNVLSKYYYISFTAIPLSFGFFLTTLLIPMILSIGLCYFISIRVLRKPTLDLLSNKDKDSPNIFVRSVGYVIPAKTPFNISYASKGFLREINKSTLLFLSVFLSVFLTSFSMSTTTMIKTQTKRILSYLNYDAIALDLNGNSSHFKYYDMYDENNEITYKSLDTIEIEKKWYTNNKNDSSGYLEELISEVNAKDLKLNYSDIENPTGFYISSSSMANLTYADYMYGGFNIHNLDHLIDRWVAQTTQSAYNYYEINDLFNLKDIDSKKGLADFINEWTYFINELAPDLVVGDYYANQNRDAVLYAASFAPPYKAYNDKKHDSFKDWYELIDKKHYKFKGNDNKMFTTFASKEQFMYSWGSNQAISDKIWNDSFRPSYQKYQEDGEWKEDFIPVIASTQTKMFLEDLAKITWTDEYGNEARIVDKTGKDTYEISIQLRTSLEDDDDPPVQEDEPSSTTYIKAKVKIVYDIFVGFDMGLLTINPFVDGYLKYYEDNQPDADNDQLIEGFKVLDDGKTFSDNFSYTPSWSYRYSHERMKELQKQTPKYSPLSIVPRNNSYNYFINNLNKRGDATVSAQDLINGNTELKFLAANGTFISVETLLFQGTKVYDMIMAIFILMSVFIIFMATTIITIAMKDIIDSSKREVSMLKAFGYSNTKATFLIMIPYIVISSLALLIALPLTFVGLGILASLLTSVTGNIFVFTLTALQWCVIIGYVYGLIGLLTILGFISFYKTNSLEAIRESDE